MSLQEEIFDWARSTFGPADLRTMKGRMMDEVIELGSAINEGASPDKIAEECADVLHFLFQMCELNGIDLIRATEEKFQKNKARKWVLNGDGTGKHKPNGSFNVVTDASAKEILDALDIPEETRREASAFLKNGS